MFRVNAVRNVPVIMGNKRIGLMMGLHFDLHAKRATEMVVACGLRGKRRIECKYVTGITDEFILVDDTAKSAPERGRINKAFAFDTTGLLVGSVSDYAVDESSMSILASEVTTRYHPGTYSRQIWVFDYEYIKTGEILLPASIGCELIGTKKEEEICAWQQ